VAVYLRRFRRVRFSRLGSHVWSWLRTEAAFAKYYELLNDSPVEQALRSVAVHIVGSATSPSTWGIHRSLSLRSAEERSAAFSEQRAACLAMLIIAVDFEIRRGPYKRRNRQVANTFRKALLLALSEMDDQATIRRLLPSFLTRYEWYPFTQESIDSTMVSQAASQAVYHFTRSIGVSESDVAENAHVQFRFARSLTRFRLSEIGEPIADADSGTTSVEDMARLYKTIPAPFRPKLPG